MIKQYIKELTPTLLEELGAINTSAGIKEFSFKIDCAVLPTYIGHTNITQNETLKPLFDYLNTLNKPVVYYFEILSNHSPEDILNAIVKFKNTSWRTIPKLPKTFKSPSRVLYVGKRNGKPPSKHETNSAPLSLIAGRMIIHLGYYNKQHTQGLQLCHWATELGLKLKLHLVELPLSYRLRALSGVYEYSLARQLKPLLGTHKT